MLSRRAFSWGLVSMPFVIPAASIADNLSDDLAAPFDQLIYPSFEDIDAPSKFGYKVADEKAKAKAADIIRQTPRGPRPIDVAQSFVDRFYKSDPAAISQWPPPDAWNPLIVEFFTATSLRANNDMIPWCAAFANWCIKRCNGLGSNNPSSQSFLGKEFKPTADPAVGDLAVFTCYDKRTHQSIGLGHVAFVREKPAGNHVKLVGGNTSADGHASIVCERYFRTDERSVRRRVDARWVECTMRLNTYIKVV